MAGSTRAGSTKSGERLKIGDLARRTHKTVRTLHFYEELGILRPIDRTPGGFRLYDPDSISRVKLIEKLQILGLSLPEIRELLLGWEGSPTGAAGAQGLTALLREKRNRLSEEIGRLEQLRGELDATLDYLQRCTTGCDKITAPCDCSYCDHAMEDRNVPQLISGLYPIPGDAGGCSEKEIHG